uniref:Uncharacterized protein n=2 Tax=Anguilla anguilla TaxID=7936 RepID=A0A0E9SI38_ANGAN
MLHVQCFPGNQTQNSEFRNVIAISSMLLVLFQLAEHATSNNELTEDLGTVPKC